jgi:hypothetical protein
VLDQQVSHGQLDRTGDGGRSAGVAISALLPIDDLRPRNPKSLRKLILGEPKAAAQVAEFSAGHCVGYGGVTPQMQEAELVPWPTGSA